MKMPMLDQPAPPAADDSTCDVFHANSQEMQAVRQALIPAPLVGTLAETFRVRILDALSRAELCVCDIATLLSLTESAVSHQLRLLRSLRLVRSRRAGRMVFYALDDAHIMRLFAQGLEHVEEAMPASRRQAPAPGRQ
jgi:DNA-binding transcriptional ArsR family regulator